MANILAKNEEITTNGLISPNNNFIMPEETSETAPVTTTAMDIPLTNGLSMSACLSPKIEPDSFRDVDSSDMADSTMDVDQGDEPTNGPKQYKCYICDKLFSRNSSLKCHIRLHLEGPVNILRKGSTNRLSSETSMMERDDGGGGGGGGMEGDPLATSTAVVPNEKGLYECHLCSRSFDRKKGLFRHIGYHNSSMEQTTPRVVDSHSLDEAGSDIELSLADENSSSDHVSAPFECEHCAKRFKTVRAMKIHSTHAHREPRADGDREDEDEVEEEEEEEDEEEDDELDMEMELSVNENSADDHEEEEEEQEQEQRFQCNHCVRTFHSQRARSIHFVHAHKFGEKTSHHEATVTPSAAAAAAAAKLRADDKELSCFGCAFCPLEFRTYRLMNAHVVAEHPANFSFYCVVCQRTYETIRAFSDHGRGICGKAIVQNGMYVYACDECPKTFAHPKSMSRHMREHRNEQDQPNHHHTSHHTSQQHHERVEPPPRPEIKRESVGGGGGGVKVESQFFKCAFCVKTYPNVKALAGHMKIHNRNGENSPAAKTPSYSVHHHPQPPAQPSPCGEDDVRVYPCPYCDRTFTSNVGYAGHMKVHKDRGPVTPRSSTPPPLPPPVQEKEDERVVENEKTFVCRICNKKFSSGVQLGGHMRHHTAAMKAASVADVYDALHIDTDTMDVVQAHEDDQYICDTCDKTFVCKEELSEHVQEHASDPTAGSGGGGGGGGGANSSFGKVAQDGGLLCEYCDRPFNGVKSLKTHMYRYHRSVMMRTSRVEDKVYRCDSCEQTFTYLSELKKHTSSECYGSNQQSRKRSFPDDSMLRCEYCDQTFLLQCHLLKHMKSRCNAIDLRNELEPEPEAMNGDSGVGVGGGGEAGDILAGKRVRKSTLVSSLYEYEPIGGPRRYSHKPANLRPELGDKPYECVYCEKCFGKKEDLLRHVRTHAEIDEEDFNDYINLHAEQHFVIQNQNGDEEHFIFEQYDDNEGYQCSECDETYRDKLQMIVHMSFHVNSKLPTGGYKSSLIIRADSSLLAPYKCKFCDERFINKSYRSRHLCKCHRDEILQCEMCDKLFLHKETLKQHCKQHMVDTKYHCEYCQKCFTSKWFLKRHTRRHCVKRASAAEQTKRASDSETADGNGYPCKSEKIETHQADSEIVVDHLIKEEVPAANEVVMHMQMQSV